MIVEKSIYNLVDTHTFQASIFYIFSGISQTLPFHTFGPAKRHDFIIHFVLSGQGLFFVKDHQFQLKAGDAFLIRPQETSFYQSDIKNPWSYAWISFNGDQAAQIIEELSPFKNHQQVFHTSNNDQYLNLITETLNLSDASPQSELQLNLIVNQLLLQLSKENVPHQAPAPAFKGSRLARLAREYIDNHYEQGISVSDVAHALNIDRSYLSRVFTNNFSMSPKAWLIGVRINKASELLQSQQLTVEKIAEMVGFNNVAVFSRAFLKMTDETPSQYRKQHKRLRTTQVNFSEIQNLINTAKPVRRTT
ncbi:hypothetical protein IV73_GL000852 [Weissella kandleri]|uniref:HTH araC/xylS-type domain-containing protein n=1 Tax=Weissella kandleri TaxID=1616 RepID=A0A0R2JM08_9LACO|nr:AraC family transcriptional regulator [Weissella kandleri]KRN75092.1 hypothetical protein IV73_GL000852 [Weissella kandleri]